jgi:tetratricopeptide (TPR) repeat protein
MDQLVVLQEIYESFSKGGEVLHSIDSGAIAGCCSEKVAQLLEGAIGGNIDAGVCLGLIDCLQDVYETKRLGDICRKAGLIEMSIRAYDRALSMTRDKDVKAVLLNNLGQVYAQYGDIGRAITYYKKAAKLFLCAGDDSGLAHVQGNLGSAFRKGRDWNSAIDYCHRSLRAFEEQGDQLGAAQMTGSLGRIYAEMGETSLAAKYFEKSLRDFQRLGDRRSEAWILYRMGRLSVQGNNLEEAVRHYNKSQSIFQDLRQENSSSIVLSNLGRVNLDKGNAALARDCLERSLKSLHREMQPAYANASAALAAAYSTLAKEHLCMAGTKASSESGVPDEGLDEQLRLASQYHSRAADKFAELASIPGIELPALKVNASIARFLSAIDELQAEQKDEEALILADRAIFALEDGSSCSEGLQKGEMEAIGRTLSGMKGIWSLCMLDKEPWKLARSAGESIDLLIGGAALSGEEGACISDALNALGAAIKDEQLRRSPADNLKAAASSLRKAEKRFNAYGTLIGYNSSISLGKAAGLIEDLIAADSGSIKTPPTNISELINYRAHRAALLQIGWVLIRNSLPSIDKTDHLYSWNESMKLAEARLPGQPSEPINSPEPAVQDIMEDEEADAIEEEELTQPLVEIALETGEIASDGGSVGCLVPVTMQMTYPLRNSKATAQEMNRTRASYWVDRFVPIVEHASSESFSQEQHRPHINEAQFIEKPTAVQDGPKSSAQSESLFSGKTERRYAFGNGVISRSNLINLLKVLVVIVVVLVAIDMILYLI